MSDVPDLFGTGINFNINLPFSHFTRTRDNVFDGIMEELPICKKHLVHPITKRLWDRQGTAIVHVKARGQPQVWFLDDLRKSNEKKRD